MKLEMNDWDHNIKGIFERNRIRYLFIYSITTGGNFMGNAMHNGKQIRNKLQCYDNK